MDTKTDFSKIPHFSLYGEELAIDDPSFIHIENIAHRSQDNGWYIRPHRHGKMFQMIVILNGKTDLRLDEQKLTINKPSVITIPTGCVHGFRFAPNTEGIVLTLADSVLNTPQFEHLNQTFGVLLSHPQVLKIDTENGFLEQIMWLLEQIKWELQNPNMGRALMCEWHAMSLLLIVRRIHDILGSETREESLRSQQISHLKQLIEQNFRNQWNVQEYADAIGITTTTLNRITLQHLNKTVKTLLLERTMLEAKRRLIYTRSNLDQIAYDLGFKDPAYFSRFFKRETGLTPGQMRKEMSHDDSPLLTT